MTIYVRTYIVFKLISLNAESSRTKRRLSNKKICMKNKYGRSFENCLFKVEKFIRFICFVFTDTNVNYSLLYFDYIVKLK